jgi:hypothetical protein
LKSKKIYQILILNSQLTVVDLILFDMASIHRWYGSSSKQEDRSKEDDAIDSGEAGYYNMIE